MRQLVFTVLFVMCVQPMATANDLFPEDLEKTDVKIQLQQSDNEKKCKEAELRLSMLKSVSEDAKSCNIGLQTDTFADEESCYEYIEEQISDINRNLRSNNCTA